MTATERAKRLVGGVIVEVLEKSGIVLVDAPEWDLMKSAALKKDSTLEEKLNRIPIIKK